MAGPADEHDEIAAALHALATATPATGDDAYHHVLYAVGNDHAGTYRPEVLRVVEPLGALVRGGSPTARARALDVLIDLAGSFEPEPGCSPIETADGPRDLRELLRARIARLGDDVRACAARAQVGSEEARLAAELLALL